MATYKTEAIILSHYPYREHDRILSVYARQYGRIETRARGVRKITSKLAGHLEPFMEVELLLAHGRQWDILAGSRTRASQETLRADVRSLACACVCVEAIKVATKPFLAEERVYDTLAETLAILNTPSVPYEVKDGVVLRFLWQLLRLSGFAPELHKCIHTRTPLSSGVFSFEGGGMLSAACASRDAYAEPVDKELLIELRESRTVLPRRAQQIVLGFWHYVIDHAQLRSVRFWEEISEMAAVTHGV